LILWVPNTVRLLTYIVPETYVSLVTLNPPSVYIDADAPNPFGFVVSVMYCIPVNVFDPVIANSVLFFPSNKSELAALVANEELIAFCA